MAALLVSPSNARIDWELLPSLRAAVRTKLHRGDPTWQATVMSDFDPPADSEPFEEVMPGLAVREVREPDIFRFFFGRIDRSSAAART